MHRTERCLAACCSEWVSVHVRFFHGTTSVKSANYFLFESICLRCVVLSAAFHLPASLSIDRRTDFRQPHGKQTRPI